MVFNWWWSAIILQWLTDWWCLMFTVLAAGVGISYFILSWSSNTLAFVSIISVQNDIASSTYVNQQHITTAYRKEYFENVLLKPVAYYDEEDNSVGSLTGRMASDPTQLQQLLGFNMAMVFISLINVLGCMGISFYFGWKLTLITVCSSMPIILAAGFVRLKFETQFEKMNFEVFAESAKFATESIGAIRTVTAMTMEDTICRRYEKLLHEHTREAFRKARFTTFIFAVSDSISLLCMAFVLW